MLWMKEQIFCEKTYKEKKSFKIVQGRFRRKFFNFNTFSNRVRFFKLVKNFEAHGTYEDCRTTDSSPYDHNL